MSQVQINDVTMSAVRNMLVSDESFRSLVQQRLQQAADEAAKQAEALKAAATFEGGEVSASPERKRPGRKPGSKNSGGDNKMEALTRIIQAGKGLTLDQIRTELQRRGVELEGGMVSTYLYQLQKRGDVTKTGKRGESKYFLAGK